MTRVFKILCQYLPQEKDYNKYAPSNKAQAKPQQQEDRPDTTSCDFFSVTPDNPGSPEGQRAAMAQEHLTRGLLGGQGVAGRRGRRPDWYDDMVNDLLP